MTIHLRTITAKNGDAVDYLWYCCQACYSQSFVHGIGTVSAADGIEEGGAYPCGAEHDAADYCATCGDPIGNPLTSEGEASVIEYVREVDECQEGRTGSTHTERAEALRREYGYLWHPLTGEAIHG